ncbi:hypothetical protein OTU49_004403 [Cherax quadricarinatus]|uniref:Uncharacterized protein n=1 Tax=Cherax quadricarinatus TaxID=27406 RepID=A0AAW0XBA8_CHEQU
MTPDIMDNEQVFDKRSPEEIRRELDFYIAEFVKYAETHPRPKSNLKFSEAMKMYEGSVLPSLQEMLNTVPENSEKLKDKISLLNKKMLIVQNTLDNHQLQNNNLGLRTVAIREDSDAVFLKEQICAQKEKIATLRGKIHSAGMKTFAGEGVTWTSVDNPGVKTRLPTKTDPVLRLIDARRLAAENCRKALRKFK